MPLGRSRSIDMARTTSVTDTRLMRRSQQGDRRAFRALLGRYDWRLRGLAHALLLEPRRVDAVLRMAYVKAWREVVRIDPREDAAAWLYRVVYNACIDGLRRESSHIGAAPPTVADAPDAPADPPPGPAIPNATGNGASSAGAHGRRTRLVEALAELAPADRVAVVLVDREGFTPDAAARILGLAPGVVHTRLAGARTRLTRQLADDLAASAGDEAATTPAGDDAAAAPADDDAAAAAADDDAAAASAGDEAATAPAGDDAAAAPAGDDAAAAPGGDDAAPAPDDDDAAPPVATAGSQSEDPEPPLDDATPADPVDATVASRSTGAPSPNGARDTGDTDGSGDGGGGER
jgi:RNA polymerase sigma-70 factor (ECF subfamily)